MKILIVDDNTSIRKVLTAFFVAQGHEVVGALADGVQVEQAVLGLQPDLICLLRRREPVEAEMAINGSVKTDQTCSGNHISQALHFGLMLQKITYWLAIFVQGQIDQPFLAGFDDMPQLNPALAIFKQLVNVTGSDERVRVGTVQQLADQLIDPGLRVHQSTPWFPADRCRISGRPPQGAQSLARSSTTSQRCAT